MMRFVLGLSLFISASGASARHVGKQRHLGKPKQFLSKLDLPRCQQGVHSNQGIKHASNMLTGDVMVTSNPLLRDFLTLC
eukprot:Skav234260  [mRNA]  locus=scaffold1464:787372:788040:+ [translate_table: standard]